VCIDLARHYTKLTGCIEQHLILCKMLEWCILVLRTLQYPVLLGAYSITALCYLRGYSKLEIRVELLAVTLILQFFYTL
jgi:hypothetical protein